MPNVAAPITISACGSFASSRFGLMSQFCYVSSNHLSPPIDESLANVVAVRTHGLRGLSLLWHAVSFILAPGVLTLQLYGRPNAKGACELEVAYSITPA